MTTIPALPQSTIGAINVSNGGTSATQWAQITSASGVHAHTLYGGGGMSGAHGTQIPAFIPMYDTVEGKYINVPYWEFHRVHEDHLKLKALAEEFPAVKKALDHLNTVVKLHRES